MKLAVRVYPRSSREEVVKLKDGGLKVYMHTPAEGGKANKRLVEMIAEYLVAKKSEVKIIKGRKSRNKIIEIDL
ncbi:MAG: DUF167 domain-containing protein [Candidatus Omnitrophota bacterium]